MLLNSNSDNSNFSLIRTFFSVLWPKNALNNSDFRTFTVVTNGKKNEDKYLIFTLIGVKYLLVYKQILLLQKNEVCRESVAVLHRLNLLFCTLTFSTRQQFSLLARRKYETVLTKRADLPLERCPATSQHLSTATAYLSYSFLVLVEL